MAIRCEDLPDAIKPPAGGRDILRVGIATDEPGDVWLMNEEGILVRLVDGRSVVPRVGGADNLTSLAQEPKGRIW